MVKELQTGLYTRYHCSLTVPDPSAHNRYTVSVKHLVQEKLISSYDHSEFAPPLHGFPVLWGPLGHLNKHRDLSGIFAFATFKDLQIFHSQ